MDGTKGGILEERGSGWAGFTWRSTIGRTMLVPGRENIWPRDMRQVAWLEGGSHLDKADWGMVVVLLVLCGIGTGGNIAAK